MSVLPFHWRVRVEVGESSPDIIGGHGRTTRGVAPENANANANANRIESDTPDIDFSNSKVRDV